MSLLFDKLSSVSATDTEFVDSCPLCDSDESTFMFWAIDRLHQLPGKFGEVRCNQCSLVRLSPRPTPESLIFYYPQDEYYSYSQVPTLPDLSAKSLKEDIRRAVLSGYGYPMAPHSSLIKALTPLLRPIFAEKATFGNGSRLPKWVPGGRALDVGCGSGNFLAILKRLGWSVKGVELSQTAADVAKAQLGIDVFVGDLMGAGFDDGEFDFISFNHSLEHLPNLKEILEEVRRILKPGGQLYIEVPNVESISQKISGQYWLHWDAPRHLFSFSPESLDNLLQSSGFRDIKIRTVRARLYSFDVCYRREDILGRKLSDRGQLVAADRVRVQTINFITTIGHVLSRQSGDYISGLASK